MDKILIVGLVVLLQGCSVGENRGNTVIDSENTKVKVLAAWMDIRLIEDNVLFKYEDDEVTCYMSEPGGLFCFQKK
jgi:hypothetical protein